MSVGGDDSQFLSEEDVLDLAKRRKSDVQSILDAHNHYNGTHFEVLFYPEPPSSFCPERGWGLCMMVGCGASSSFFGYSFCGGRSLVCGAPFGMIAESYCRGYIEGSGKAVVTREKLVEDRLGGDYSDLSSVEAVSMDVEREYRDSLVAREVSAVNDALKKAGF